ncbi:hypothetical protein [Flavobacterium sp.]|uniref:hypothetical protein n=1 Tax=Flavobacterium sp. TaxID=239 RepID=UPI002B4B5A49|nr:hypothetical protein [Flavobacterium sp.]HLP63143.1 hypothetical protein [Flavobacterium sp.]
MKNKYFFFYLILFISLSSNSQEIKFKDLNLKKALIEKGYDFNKNKEIEISEIDTVTKLKIAKSNINKLDDLIYFKKLKVLNAMANNITNLDVFYNNSVIEELYVGENKFGKKLVLKNLTNLKGLYAFRNGIQIIELKNTDNIEQLYLQGNLFENLGFTKLTKLRTLQLSGNVNLKTLDISKNTELKQLYLTDTQIKKLDISNNSILKTFYVEENVELIKSNSQDNLKAMPIIRSSN